MLTINLLPNNMILIRSHYFYKDRIRKIPSATFDTNYRAWVIHRNYFSYLEQEFQGELNYATPRWIITNESMPDYTAMYQIQDTTIKVPELAVQPYNYQTYGIRFMIDRILQQGFVLNADDVGLGKTIQSIGTMVWFGEHGKANHIFIICKKSIKRQWESELRKFAPNFVQDYQIICSKSKSTKKARCKVYESLLKEQRFIYITNYESFLHDEKELASLCPDFTIIDEVHEIKGHTGKKNHNISKVCKGHPMIFLTGTPIMSKPQDIFGIVQICLPEYFGSWEHFSEQYLVFDPNYVRDQRVIGARHLDELRNKVQSFVIRRTKNEVSIELPEVDVQPINCTKDDIQQEIMQQISKIQQEIQDRLDGLTIEQKTYHPELEEQLEGQKKGLIAARQAAASDPRLFLMTGSKFMVRQFGKLVPNTYTGSNKFQQILSLVQDIVESGNKVVLFSKFRTCAILCQFDIQRLLKYPVLLYTGKEDEIQRDFAVRNFHTPDYPIIIGTEALSTGLNLQVANYIINIDQPDTFALKSQRIGRVRRAGSSYKSVTVYDMITEESKDTERLENIRKNMDLSDALVNLDQAQSLSLIQAMRTS